MYVFFFVSDYFIQLNLIKFFVCFFFLCFRLLYTTDFEIFTVDEPMITMVRNGWPYRSFNVLLHMLLILHLFWTYIILKAAYFKIVHGEVGITTFALYTRLYGGYSAAIFRYTFGPPTFIEWKFGNPNFFWTTNFYRAKVWCPKTTFNCLIQCSMFSRIKCAYFYNKLF